MCCESAQGQFVQQQGPDISCLDPALQQQWDHAANAHLGNIVIKPHSSRRKVWWTCDQCPDGHLHSWEATVSHRTAGTGCPQCSSHKVCKHNSLATKAPKVAAQWDYEANDSTPNDVVAQSNTSVGWRCDVCGHPWTATIDSRVSKLKTGCPQCCNNTKTNKRIKHPTLAECQNPHSKAVLAEWDHERNPLQRNFPHNTTLRSCKRIFWLCQKCPAGQEHSWSAQPNCRTGRSKTGCPFCAGRAFCKCNSLPSLYPDIAAEWDYAKNNDNPNDYTARSNSPAWWCSPQRGSWRQRIDSRTDLRLECHRTKHILVNYCQLTEQAKTELWMCVLPGFRQTSLAECLAKTSCISHARCHPNSMCDRTCFRLLMQHFNA